MKGNLGQFQQRNIFEIKLKLNITKFVIITRKVNKCYLDLINNQLTIGQKMITKLK